jgi:hypothetical protein
VKRLWAALCAAVLLAAICVSGVYITRARLTGALSSISEIKTAVKQSEKEAYKLAKAFDKKWSEDEKILALFINSKSLSDVGVSISKIAPLSRVDDKGEFYAELTAARIQIIHLLNCEILVKMNKKY